MSLATAMKTYGAPGLLNSSSCFLASNFSGPAFCDHWPHTTGKATIQRDSGLSITVNQNVTVPALPHFALGGSRHGSCSLDILQRVVSLEMRFEEHPDIAERCLGWLARVIAAVVDCIIHEPLADTLDATADLRGVFKDGRHGPHVSSDSGRQNCHGHWPQLQISG